MEHRRKRATRPLKKTRSLGKKVVAKDSAVIPMFLPNLAQLITDGEITVGVLRPVGCVATATDGYNSLAMLVRRRGETFAQLLTLTRPSRRQSAHRRRLH